MDLWWLDPQCSVLLVLDIMFCPLKLVLSFKIGSVPLTPAKLLVGPAPSCFRSLKFSKIPKNPLAAGGKVVFPGWGFNQGRVEVISPSARLILRDPSLLLGGLSVLTWL